jgi:cysteinyl-tRNA synthetase
MNDDLAVPQALALISEWLKAGNMAINANDISAMSSAASEIRGALDILGCDPFDVVFAVTSKRPDQAIDGLIALLLEQREAARLRKDFAAADAIRDRIVGLGITIEDTANGPRWSVN